MRVRVEAVVEAADQAAMQETNQAAVEAALQEAVQGSNGSDGSREAGAYTSEGKVKVALDATVGARRWETSGERERERLGLWSLGLVKMYSTQHNEATMRQRTKPAD